VVSAALLGVGTAMVYPALIASVADHTHPSWRAQGLGVYRFWRDLGYGLTITIPVGQRVHPLPEGDRYLGFIFAEGDTHDRVEAALRAARDRLRVVID
jgi:MFS family permease